MPIHMEHKAGVVFAEQHKSDVKPLLKVKSSFAVRVVLIAAVLVSGCYCFGQSYTILSQQSPTYEFYPRSIFTTPLPSNVGSHLIANSDTIVRHIFNGNIANAQYSVIGGTGVSSSAFGGPIYYSTASDPIYKVTSCVYQSSGSHAMVGKYFHITNQAAFDGTTMDQALNFWDQSTDIDSTPGGRVGSFYSYDSGAIKKLPGCACKTKACTDSTNSCHLAMYYCTMDYPQQDTRAGAINQDAYATGGYAPLAGTLRDQEMMAATANHALLLNTACVQNGPSFPSISNAHLCIYTSIGNDLLRPHNGALFWIDSGYNCSSLPAWQEAVCKAMQTYGGYLTDSGGGFYSGIYISHVESTEAYDTAGINAPIYSYLNSLTTGPCPGSLNYINCEYTSVGTIALEAKPGLKLAALYFFNMPGLLGHLHIVDPCIPKQMAGIAATCTGSPAD